MQQNSSANASTNTIQERHKNEREQHHTRLTRNARAGGWMNEWVGSEVGVVVGWIGLWRARLLDHRHELWEHPDEACHPGEPEQK